MSITEPLDDLGTCLVTGAAGFLGSHLVRRLLDEGYPVRAVIRNTPLDLEHPKLEIVKGDIEDAPRMLELCEGIDTVFHTAAHLALLGGSAASAAYRQAAYDANVGGVENLVAACYAQGVSRFVHTSSIDVCFNSEENLEMNGNTPYATNMSCLYTETKIEGEKLVLAANGERGLLTTSLRPDGIYGPGNNLMLDEMFKQVTKSRRSAFREHSTTTFTSTISCMPRSSLPSTWSPEARSAARPTSSPTITPCTCSSSCVL